MIIFYGTGNAKCRVIPTPVDCPHCGEKKSLVIIPRQNSAHVFWIPLFPLNRTYEWICSKCDGVPEEYLPVPKEIKKQVRTPKRTYFAGLFIVVFVLLMLVWGSIESSGRQKSMRAMIEAPTVGDVYDIIWDTDKGEYSMMKIMSAMGDSVYFFHHEYNVDTKEGVVQLKAENPDDYLTDEEMIEGFTKAELLQMFDDGEIFGVNRM